MKKTAFVFAALMLAAVMAISLVACSMNPGGAESTSEIPKRTTVVDDPLTYTVELEGNPTTGFEWTCTVEDNSVLTLVSDNYSANLSDKNVTGSGGKYSFVFKGASAGETTVTFSYARAWERTEADETRSFLFTVDEDMSITCEELYTAAEEETDEDLSETSEEASNEEGTEISEENTNLTDENTAE